MMLRSTLVFVVGAIAGAACDNTRPSPPPKDAEKPSVVTAPVTDAAPPTSSAPPVNDAGGTKCGDATCPAGQVCCNASCGICTPPDGACIQMACAPKDAGDATALSPSACSSDADCTTHSSYCGDMPCACLAVGKGAGAPKCKKPNAVQCLVDPCKGKTARCQSGSCVVTLK